MANLILNVPVANQNVLLGVTDNITSIDLDFPIGDALFERVDNNLEIYFEDSASSIILEDFYTTYNSDNLPDFLVDNSVLSGGDFFAALDSSLMPAAGDAATTPSNDGLNFGSFNQDSLASGLDSFSDTTGGSNYGRENFDGVFASDAGIDNVLLAAGDIPNIPSLPPLEPSVVVTREVTEGFATNVQSFGADKAMILGELGFAADANPNFTYEAGAYDVGAYNPSKKVTSLQFDGFNISAQIVEFSDDNSSYKTVDNPSSLTFVYREDNSDGIDSSAGLGLTSNDDKNNSKYETGFNSGTNEAEMFVIKLDEGKTSDKVEINLGTFFGAHSADSVAETALIEFYDINGNLIHSEIITSTTLTGSQSFTFEVDNFHEIRLAPSDNGTNSSDFTLEGINISDTVQTVSGEIEVENFGEGHEYEIGSVNGVDVSDLFQTGTFSVDGVGYVYTKTNNSFTLFDNGEELFSIEVSSNGKYTITEHQEMPFDLEVTFDVTNSAGEEMRTDPMGLTEEGSLIDLTMLSSDPSLAQIQTNDAPPVAPISDELPLEHTSDMGFDNGIDDNSGFINI